VIDELKQAMSEMDSSLDCIMYFGPIDRTGYDSLTSLIEKKEAGNNRSDKVFFVLATYGGNPDAGYRIARALGHYYPAGVIVYIPDMCKSAGTLIALGSSELVISDRGELGPLDVQFAKKEELFEMSSGLDIVKSLKVLEDEVGAAFKDYLIDLRLNGIGTKMAAKLASRMAVNLMSPITGQIDPIRLGEHQRALLIALAYGKRLCKKFENISPDDIDRLTMSYPSHGFVIDRKEASELFANVRAPSEQECKLENFLRSKNLFSAIQGSTPTVLCLSDIVNFNEGGDDEEERSDTAHGDEEQVRDNAGQGQQEGDGNVN